MKTNIKWLRKFNFGLCLLAALLAFGCAKTVKKASRSQTGIMDTPAFHIGRGDDALLTRQYGEARDSYEQALSLEEDSSAALSGLAVSLAHLAEDSSISQRAKKRSFDKAEKLLEEALENASDDQKNQVRAHNFAVRVYAILQMPKDLWYEKATEHYQEAMEINTKDPAAHFFMAKAHSAKLQYTEAMTLYNKVLTLGGRYEEEANQELERIQRVQRALPGSRFGATVANVEEMTRADMAALFIAELRLDRLYQDQNVVASAGFAVPQSQTKLRLDPLQKYPDAVDLSGHPLERAMLEMIKLGVKGLEPDPAHKFYPDQKVTRAEFALMIQDILVKVTKQTALETQFLGQDSPFPDVRPDVWYYNATRVVVTRGLITVNNKVTGEFEPFSSVSGADALLSIRTLKGILKAYLR
ncbi:MAG: hypothetical protein COB67_09525 [SAR324 cluster bacterium]|uniref:SLH domain-containing protein n=1 Tax=SAR324 cluster bacterium TaxID=2024889 RepID=A0A2A4T0C1_9DELT|nr:MAG: hypothetical protein COB67_09525 [SAR324 cluster bacterium]